MTAVSENRHSHERQGHRYKPHKSDIYFEYNSLLTAELEKIHPLLIGKQCLDIGAGEIPFREFYSQGLKVDTCDIAQNSKGTIDHIILPDERLPFENASYDVVFIFDVLEHIKDDVFMMSEFKRILKPGGLILGSVPFLYRFHEIPYDYRRYTPSGLQYLFSEKTSLEIDRIVPLGSHVFIAEKIFTERDIRLSIWRKIVYRCLTALLKNLSRPEEISSHTAFAYFFMCRV